MEVPEIEKKIGINLYSTESERTRWTAPPGN